jgi:pyruvate dehydrogenase E1 component alpha subunit
LGREACLASTSVDLGPGDLVSDALSGGVVEYLRGATLAAVLRPGVVSRKRVGAAECGAAARLPGTPGAAERIWAALGAAAALKAEAGQAKADAKLDAGAVKQKGVVVAYVLPGEAAEPLWRKALTFAAKQELPVIFVALPLGRERGSVSRAGRLAEVAQSCGVPGIAVDAADAVAIYRVAQESIGHARTGGGAALMECIPFVLAGAAAKRGRAGDAVQRLEEYMLKRGVASRAWMDREAKAFTRAVAKAASQ